LQEFASAIREARPAESNISQATHTMAVFEAMWESAHGGGEVAVRYQP
jgi:predicted dehydrogenase